MRLFQMLESEAHTWAMGRGRKLRRTFMQILEDVQKEGSKVRVNAQAWRRALLSLDMADNYGEDAQGPTSRHGTTSGAGTDWVLIWQDAHNAVLQALRSQNSPGHNSQVDPETEAVTSKAPFTRYRRIVCKTAPCDSRLEGKNGITDSPEEMLGLLRQSRAFWEEPAPVDLNQQFACLPSALPHLRRRGPHRAR
jgi:hypothetical protein